MTSSFTTASAPSSRPESCAPPDADYTPFDKSSVDSSGVANACLTMSGPASGDEVLSRVVAHPTDKVVRALELAHRASALTAL
jgi:hypothetical protein